MCVQLFLSCGAVYLLSVKITFKCRLTEEHLCHFVFPHLALVDEIHDGLFSPLVNLSGLSVEVRLHLQSSGAEGGGESLMELFH